MPKLGGLATSRPEVFEEFLESQETKGKRGVGAKKTGGYFLRRQEEKELSEVSGGGWRTRSLKVLQLRTSRSRRVGARGTQSEGMLDA